MEYGDPLHEARMTQTMKNSALRMLYTQLKTKNINLTKSQLNINCLTAYFHIIGLSSQKMTRHLKVVIFIINPINFVIMVFWIIEYHKTYMYKTLFLFLIIFHIYKCAVTVEKASFFLSLFPGLTTNLILNSIRNILVFLCIIAQKIIFVLLTFCLLAYTSFRCNLLRKKREN